MVPVLVPVQKLGHCTDAAKALTLTLHNNTNHDTPRNLFMHTLDHVSLNSPHTSPHNVTFLFTDILWGLHLEQDKTHLLWTGSQLFAPKWVSLEQVVVRQDGRIRLTACYYLQQHTEGAAIPNVIIIFVSDNMDLSRPLFFKPNST